MDEKLDISTYSGWLDDGRRWTVTVNNKPTVPELVLHVDHLEVGGEKFDDLGTVRVRR